jgi:hypothetical protein
MGAVALAMQWGFNPVAVTVGANSSKPALAQSTCERLGPVKAWNGHVKFTYDFTQKEPDGSGGTYTDTYHNSASYSFTLGRIIHSPPSYLGFMGTDTKFRGDADINDLHTYVTPTYSAWLKRKTTGKSRFETVGNSILDIDTAACTYGFRSGVEAQNVSITSSSGSSRTDDDVGVGFVRLPMSERPFGRSLELTGHERVPEPETNGRGFSVGYAPSGNGGSANVRWSFTPVGVCSGELSGPEWVERFPDSKKVADLVEPFRGDVEKFLGALDNAHAGVSIGTTYRPKERGYLMRFSYDIAHGADPAKVPKYAPVNVCWVHKTPALSREEAAKMVKAYQIVYRPAWPTSRHFEHKAIDMTISWQGTLKIRDASGHTVEIATTPRTGMNTELWAVGKTYGVIKGPPNDAPHWSTDGR